MGTRWVEEAPHGDRRMTENIPVCEWCSETLYEEEAESPRHSKDGDVICDECFDDEYTYTCNVCDEEFSEDFTKRISPQYILITEYASEYIDLPAGVYEITAYPFFADSVIDIHIFKGAVHKVAGIPTGFNEDEHDSDISYVCDDCAQKIIAENKPRSKDRGMP